MNKKLIKELKTARRALNNFQKEFEKVYGHIDPATERIISNIDITLTVPNKRSYNDTRTVEGEELCNKSTI